MILLFLFVSILVILRILYHRQQEKRANKIIKNIEQWKQKYLSKFKKINKKNQKVEKILVTGGCGNFGTVLIEMLLIRFPNVKIICLDRITNKSTVRVNYVSGDVTNKKSIEKFFKGVDTVFHTAAIVELDCNKEKIFTTNIIGTQNILECCLENDVSNFIHTSSTTSFQPNKNLINVNETVEYTNDHDSYGESKKHTEMLVLEVNGRNGLKTVAFSTAGLWGPFDKIAFETLAKTINFPVSISKLSSAVITNCYVENAAHAQILGLENIEIAQSNRYLVSDDEEIPLSEFQSKVIEEFTHQKPIFYNLPYFLFFGSCYFMYYFKWFLDPLIELKVPITKGFIQYSIGLTLDISKIKKELKYKPLYTISQAVKKSVQIYNSRIKK